MTVAARFLPLIYSILEELSLHGLFHRSDCSWLFRSCFKSSYLATLSVTGDGQSPTLPSGAAADLPSPAPCRAGAPFFPTIPRSCWVGLMGERHWLKGTYPTPTKRWHFIVTSSGVQRWPVARIPLVWVGRAFLHSSNQTALIIQWSTMTNSEKTGLFAEWFPLAELCRIWGCCVAGSQDKTLL